MDKAVTVKQIKAEGIASMEFAIELHLKIVDSVVSLKMSELATKAAAENKVTEGNPVWLWTLPDGTVTGDLVAVRDYFSRLVVEPTEDYLKMNFMKILRNMIAELDKLTVEIVGVQSAIEA